MKHRIVVLGAGYAGAFAAGNLARRLSPLMERLSPVERAAYVLREAFSYPRAEIAGILDITESASQQHVHRARRRVTAERRGGDEVDPASVRRIVEEFLAAATSGRTERLVALLTDDVTAVSDGAGLVRRLLRYETRERVASYVRAGFKPTAAKRRLAGGSPAFHIALVNGSPAVLAVVEDRVVGAVAFEASDGKVASLRGIAAADRLARQRGLAAARARRAGHPRMVTRATGIQRPESERGRHPFGPRAAQQSGAAQAHRSPESDSALQFGSPMADCRSAQRPTSNRH